MYNANTILKTSYYTAIKAALPSAQVFKDYVPNELITDNYFLISNVQNVDAGSKNIDMYKVFVTIGIYTRVPTENDGLTMESMADALFSLYPTPQDYPTITGYNLVTRQKESDNELTVSLDSGNIYVNRIITFSHILQQLN